MKTKTRWYILSGVLVLLLITGILLMGRDVTVTIDGQTSVIHTRAITVGGALRGMGVTLTQTDRVDPPAATWLSRTTAISLDRSRPVTVWVDPMGTHVEFESAAKTPREVLVLLGITANEEDSFKLNGSPIQIDDPLPAGTSILLQYKPAVTIDLSGTDKKQAIKSNAETLGQALWQGGVHLRGGDSLSLPFMQALDQSEAVKFTQAIPLTISVDDKTIQANSTAKTVGEALAANGISLQNLDYSTPADDSPLPKDGKISVVRVRLLVLDEQQVIPYTVENNYDSSLSAATKIVTRAGKSGLSNVRVIVRYENGIEKSRETESKIVLQDAVNEQVTTGTQTVSPTVPPDSVGTIDTGNGVYGYYLSMSVHATSYSPCNSGSSCMYYTASGAPVTQGVIAVTTAWYRILKGYKVYVPGYGIASVEDTGGGIPGENWIDLGFTDETYVPWSKWVTVYFLSPAPANFSGSLP